MPKRFVTGFVLDCKSKLPVEVSRGVRHSEEPNKHFWWSPIIANSKIKSYIILQEYKDQNIDNVYGKARLCVYNSLNKNVVSSECDLQQLLEKKLIDIETIFDNLDQILGGKIGYLTLSSQHPSLDILIAMEDCKGNIGMEHFF